MTFQDGGPRFSSIDELLGDSQTRFFGSGFRLVKQKIVDVEIAPQLRTATAVAKIDYPAAWSTKSSRELKPHLSTLDAFIIGVQLCETFIRTAYGLDDQAVERVWVARSTLKPANTPTLDLASVPASCKLIKTEAAAGSLCGYLSSFTAQVGAIALEYTLDHPMGSVSDAPARWGQIEDLLGPSDHRYYGAGYARTQLGLREVEFDGEGTRVRSMLDLHDPIDAPILSGMSSAYLPFVSMTNVIVGLAQLAQALMYRYDNIQRAASHNLWMRKVALVAGAPATARRGLVAETWSTKMNLLSLKDALWRSCSFELTVPGITGEYNLAHQLPAHEQRLRDAK